MSGDICVCEIDPSLQNLLKEFRFRKEQSHAALIMKVDKERQVIVLDQELKDTSIEELLEELPDHQPRYVLLSYKLVHPTDGRLSFPLCFIFISPRDGNPELQMMYAGSKISLVKMVDCGKVFELRELEELTEEWLLNKLVK